MGLNLRIKCNTQSVSLIENLPQVRFRYYKLSKVHLQNAVTTRTWHRLPERLKKELRMRQSSSLKKVNAVDS